MRILNIILDTSIAFIIGAVSGGITAATIIGSIVMLLIMFDFGAPGIYQTVFDDAVWPNVLFWGFAITGGLILMLFKMRVILDSDPFV